MKYKQNKMSYKTLTFKLGFGENTAFIKLPYYQDLFYHKELLRKNKKGDPFT